MKEAHLSLLRKQESGLLSAWLLGIPAEAKSQPALCLPPVILAEAAVQKTTPGSRLRGKNTLGLTGQAGGDLLRPANSY